MNNQGKKDVRGASAGSTKILLIILACAAVLLGALILAFYFAGYRHLKTTYISAFDGSEQTISFSGFVLRDNSLKNGTLTYDSGSAKVFRDDDGVYTLTYSNGDVYTGEMDGLQRQGKGTLIYKTGETYTGDFENDRFHGKGVFVYANGDRYEGQFAGGKKSGKGVYTWLSSDKKTAATYEGSFENDLRSGYGVYTEASGSVYKGNYVNDLREDENAIVEIVTGSGAVDRYFGGYKKDKRSGYGCYFYANGDVYVGQFENNNLNGKGTIYRTDGGSYTGVFEQGNIKTDGAEEVSAEEAQAKLAELKRLYG